MGLINAAAGLAFRRRLKQLYHRAADPGPVQERVIARLVRRARDTEWGRAHNFAAIRSATDFQERVPLATFADLQASWQRAEAGECDVLWPGRTRYFAVSAGTTSGSKHIPVTASAVRANQRAGRDVVALCFRQMGHRDVTGGRFLYLGGSATLRESEVEPAASARGGPSLMGDASGIMSAHIPSFARRYHLPDPEVAAIKNWEEKIDRICGRYLTAPVQVVSILPSWSLPLFERVIAAGRERLGSHVRTVSQVWPRLGAVVSFGMALEPYLPSLEALIGRRICYINTYSSSEGGMTAVQDEQPNRRGKGGGQPGMLILPDNGVFYEFVRLDEAEDPKPQRLELANVDLDVPYEVIISTNGGIWGYRLGDVVRFVSLRPHRLVAAGRTSHRLNAFGEHLIGEELESAVIAACDAANAEVADFSVQAVYAEPGRVGQGADRQAPEAASGRGRHRWYVEFRRSPADLDAFGRAVDRHLIAINEDYEAYREGDMAVGPPEIVPLAPGTFHEWMRRAGRMGGQYKIPRVLSEPAEAERLRAVSDELSTHRP